MASAAAPSVPAPGQGRDEVAPGTVRLARRIVDMAAAGGWPSGRHITEAELVVAIGVSRTPIRGALRLLAAEGVLAWRPNQGFFLRDEAGLAAFDLEQVPTAVETLYGRLLRDRIAGELPPEVTQAALARRYGAGRSILAQVLARLADDGLIRRGEGRNWLLVATLTDRGSVRASYEFRLAVEPAALLSRSFQVSREALTRLGDRHLALIDRLERPGTRPDSSQTPLRALIVGLDADFHEGLASLSGNPFALAAVKQQVSLRRLLEFGIQESAGRVTLWCHEHLAVLAALLDGDAERASLRMREHLAKALARVPL